MYEVLDRLLNERGITAYRLAQETGVSTATLTGWKQGKYTPKQDKLQKIADYFGVTVSYLLGGSGDDAAPKQPYYSLTNKDEKDIAKRIEHLMDSLETEDSLAFHGGEMSDETRELLKMALEHGMRIATETAKKKYTPKKYRK